MPSAAFRPANPASALLRELAVLEGELGKLQLVKRHSTIEVTRFLSQLQHAKDTFLRGLDEKEKAQRDVTDDDPTRKRLDAIFANRIGAPPEEGWLKELEKEAKLRYEVKRPPGFCDQAKEGEIFTHRGIVHKSELGDLILWKQILAQARDKEIKQLIFVTDDEKEDWWSTTESGGAKRTGPRPELIEEANQAAGVERLLVLNSERFTSVFAESLRIKLEVNTITQVTDVKSTLFANVRAACPHCTEFATVRLGLSSGSSAVHVCDACSNRYHIHRGSDGEVFTKTWGSTKTTTPRIALATHRVEATCPKCRENVPANIRDGEPDTKRYCMRCCSLLTITQDGSVISSQPSSPLHALHVYGGGRNLYLSCPECTDAPPVRSLWSDGTISRAVCTQCEKLIEGAIPPAIPTQAIPENT